MGLGLGLVAELAFGCGGGDAVRATGPSAASTSGGSSSASASIPGLTNSGASLPPEAGSSSGSSTATLDPNARPEPSPEAGSGDTGSGGDASTRSDHDAAQGGAAPDDGGPFDDAPGADVGVPPPGDGGGYSPCPPRPAACKIMPLGDSITQGFRSSQLGGYRVELFQNALNDKKTITFVGSQTGGPPTVGGVPFSMSHEGHGGFTIDGIQQGIVSWMTAAKPDIVTLMIGTNDVNNFYSYKSATGAELAAAPTRFAKLVDTILAQDGHTFLIVAQITPTRLDPENLLVQTYNSAIVALVKARADAGKHVALVDMYTAFMNTPNYKTTLMHDDLHPNDQGYKVMGDVWFPAVNPLVH